MAWTALAGWILVSVGLIGLFGAYGALGAGVALLVVAVLDTRGDRPRR